MPSLNRCGCFVLPVSRNYLSSTARSQPELKSSGSCTVREICKLSSVAETRSSEGRCQSLGVPAWLETVVTQAGMLQLWCVARDGRRWKLEFNVRERVAA